MAIPLTCGECGKQFKVKEEYAGRKTRCTGCNALIRIPGEKIDDKQSTPAPKPRAAPPPLPRTPTAPPPPPQRPPQRIVTIEQPREDFDFDEPDEEPVRPASRDRERGKSAKGSWRAVASGVTSVAIGGMILALVALVLLLLPDDLEPIASLNWLIGLILFTLAGFVVGLTGKMRSRGAPDQSVRGLAGTSGILAMFATGVWGIVVILMVILRLQSDEGRGPASGALGMLYAMLYATPIAITLAFIAEAFHARMLAKVYYLFRRDGLATFSTVLFFVFLVLGGLFAIFFILLLLGTFSDGRRNPFAVTDTVETLLVIQAILWLASTVAYIVLLFLTRGVVSGGNPPPSPPRSRFDEDDAPPRRRDRRSRDQDEDEDDRDRGRSRPSRRPRDDDDD
jgi:hypothetical protein